MKERTTTPFLKWAGGKAQLLERIKERMPEEYNNYYEPFIGGGAVLFGVQPECATVNDANEQLVNAYKQLKKNSKAVIEEVKKLDAIDCDKERYYAVREQYNNKIIAGESDVECAALMIWINKHCFNGLYRVNGKGLFNVSYNNKKKGNSINEENLDNINKYLRKAKVKITCGDFEKACKDVAAGDFVYFDSPYVPVSETAYFTDYTKDGFSLEDHKRLAELFKELDGRGAKLMLSNHNVPLVHELYNGYNIEVVEVKRNINGDSSKRTGEEVIITNY